ncbi:hypothetical protein STENM327S_03589 [Streptomyces tendae]
MARLAVAALGPRRARRGPARARLPGPGPVVVGLVRADPWILLARTAPGGRRAAYDGWCGGFGFVLAMHHWLLPNLHVFTFVIAALLGALWVPWGWLVRRTLGGAPSAGRVAAALVVCRRAGCWRSWSAPGRGSAAPGGCSAPASGRWPRRCASPRWAACGCSASWWWPSTPRSPSSSPCAAPGCRPWPGLLAAAAATSAAWVWSPRPGTDERAAIAVVQPGRRRRGGQRRPALRPRGAADPAARGPGPRSDRLGREQRRFRPGRTAGPRPAARRAVPGDRGGHPGQRGRAALRQTRHLQEFGARRPPGRDRRPVRQDATRPLRGVRALPLTARLGHLRGQGGG